LGYMHIDSGSLYRGATAAALRTSLPPHEWTSESVLRDAHSVSLEPGRSAAVALIDGHDVEEELRGSAVTANVSLVAKMPDVRAWVNDRVRECARNHDVVVD